MVDSQTDESLEPTNESSFNRFSDGVTMQHKQNRLIPTACDMQSERNELKCIEQHHSEVFSDGASVNDRDESW